LLLKHFSAPHHTYYPNAASRSFYRRAVLAVRSPCTDGFVMDALINCGLQMLVWRVAIGLIALFNESCE